MSFHSSEIERDAVYFAGRDAVTASHASLTDLGDMAREAVQKRGASGRLYRGFLKRAFESLLIIFTMPFWVPVVLLSAILIWMDGGKPFYTQQRIGRNGRLFRIIKLRTMVVDADAQLKAHLESNPEARSEWDATQKLKADPRVTRIGRLLRKTSMDELPQLLNVLNGTMSLVGPRPMMVDQKDFYQGDAYYRLRPGITGLWQISERNESEFTARVRYDEEYDRNLSFAQDMSILFQTVAVVLRCTGY